jgi:copper chaperone CopZ
LLNSGQSDFNFLSRHLNSVLCNLQIDGKQLPAFRRSLNFAMMGLVGNFSLADLSFLWGAQKMLRRYSLSVEGMHCAACAETVAKALMSVKGVRKAIVNIATERALIEAEDGIDFRAIASAVENAGYKLTTRTLNFALDKPLDDKAIQTLLRSNGVIAC